MEGTIISKRVQVVEEGFSLVLKNIDIEVDDHVLKRISTVNY